MPDKIAVVIGGRSDVKAKLEGASAFTTCDVSSWSDLNGLPSAVCKAFGSEAVADIWVAGAGVFEPQWSSFLRDTEEEHYETMSITAEHPVKLIRIAVRSLLGANKPGVILLVASTAGIKGSYTAPLYCATKHAVVEFTKSMAQADKQENIKVVSVLPGMVDTPLWTSEVAKAVADQHSFASEMYVTAEEVGKAMVELIQEEKYPGGSLVEVSKKDLRGKVDSHQAYELTTSALEALVEKSLVPNCQVFHKERKFAL